MVAGTQQQPQQLPLQAQPQQQQQLPISAEEEALKRNTDCVYFLASPLTCKKVSFSPLSVLFIWSDWILFVCAIFCIFVLK